MKIREGKRKDLIEILGGKPVNWSSSEYHSETLPSRKLPKDMMYMIWEDDIDFNKLGYRDHFRKTTQTPYCIIVNEDSIRDFLAWTSTFFPGYRPFTAFIRVIDTGTAKRYPYSSNIKNNISGIENACIGILVGEAIALAGDNSDLDKITPVACASTFSYCIARALVLGTNLDDIDLIKERWLLARHTTGQVYRKIELNQLVNVWRTLYSLKTNSFTGIFRGTKSTFPDNIFDACVNLLENGNIEEHTWDYLTEDAYELKNAIIQMEGPREERVQYFKKVTSDAIMNRIRDKTHKDFVFSYLVSLLSPGTIDHLDFVTTNIHRFQNSLIWYGMLAGLHPNSKIMSDFNVLGRRIIRDIVKEDSILSPPSYDISLDELEVLLSSNAKPVPFRAFTSNRLEVELFPCLSTYIKWPTKEYSEQLGLFSEDSYLPYNKDLLYKLGNLLSQATEVQRKIVKSLNDKDVSSSKKKSKRNRKSRTKRLE